MKPTFEYAAIVNCGNKERMQQIANLLDIAGYTEHLANEFASDYAMPYTIATTVDGNYITNAAEDANMIDCYDNVHTFLHLAMLKCNPSGLQPVLLYDKHTKVMAYAEDIEPATYAEIAEWACQADIEHNFDRQHYALYAAIMRNI